MSEQKLKIRKTLRIQSKENIEESANNKTLNVRHSEKDTDEEDLNSSYEQGGLKSIRNLKRGLINFKMPKANHVIIDAMKIEDDYEFGKKDLKENLDDWYERTKSKFHDIKEDSQLVNVSEIKNQNQQRLLIEAMKEKFKSPDIDQNIINSILQPNPLSASQFKNESGMQHKENSPLNAIKVMERNSFSHSNRTQKTEGTEKVSRNSFQTFQLTQSPLKGGSKRTVFNVNAANTQGNICTSLTLLQQYNPNKEYKNPEIVKKNNITNMVHKIIQGKMQKIMTNPKEYFDKYQGIKNTNDLGDTVHNETLKNFKNLRKYFKYGQKIDYDTLLSKLLASKSLPKQFFNFTEDEINPASSFKDVEPELLNRFININKSIEEKKSQQRIFRIEVAKWIQILNDNQIELTFTQNRSDELMQHQSTLDKQIKRTSAMQKSNAFKAKQTQKSKQTIDFNENIQSELDKMNGAQTDMQQQQQKLLDKCKELEMILQTLQQDIEAMISHIDQCDSDIEKLKLSRVNLKTYLGDNYIKMLKKDFMSLPTSSRENVSFVWIVKSMNQLHESIERGAFPQYIDEQSLEFLQKAAKLEQEIEDLRYQMRGQDFSKIDVSQQKKEKYDKVIDNLQRNTTKQEIQKKLKSITGECLQVKKPIFQINNDSKKHEIQWICDTANGEGQSKFSKYETEESNLQNSVQERQRILETIQHKLSHYQKMKDSQLARLIQQNEKREDPNLLKKLIALLGTIDGTNEHHNYIHETQCFIKKVQQNKNFSFMNNYRRVKLQSSSSHTQLMRSSERVTSSSDLKNETSDNMSMTSTKFTSSRQNLLNSTTISNLTDKYIQTIKGSKNGFNQYQQLGNNLQIDAFDTFMGFKSKIQTPSVSRIGTAYNALTTESRQTSFKPSYQMNSLRNLSMNL